MHHNQSRAAERKNQWFDYPSYLPRHILLAPYKKAFAQNSPFDFQDEIPSFSYNFTFY